MESLEQRELLSVTPLAPITFKSKVAFTATSYDVTGFYNTTYKGKDATVDFTSGQISFGGTMAYTSLTYGTMANKGSWVTGSGTTTSMGYGGRWYVTAGNTIGVKDINGVLTGKVQIQGYVEFPGGNRGSLDGKYTIKNGRLNASDFSISLNVVSSDGKLYVKNGTFDPYGTYKVVASPTWNGDGTINVGVNVPGEALKSGATRATPATYIRLYWARGTRWSDRMGDPLAGNKIPVYWNERSGQYQVSDVGSAPVGATHLLFVTSYGGKNKVVGNLALPTVRIGPETVVEGNDPAVPNEAVFTVTLSRPWTKDVTVWYATGKGDHETATAGSDYVSTKGSLVIHAGETQSDAIHVPIIGDTMFERNEVFTVTLTKAQNAGIKKAQVLGTITNDDLKPFVTINDVSLPEGNSGSTAFLFTVTLSNASYQPITIAYATANGTAKTGDRDYVGKTGVLNFAPGDVMKRIKVLVNGDTKVEADETFAVNLTLPPGLLVASRSDVLGLGTIINDDGLPPPSASRGAALSQFAGPAELASYFERPTGRQNDKDATDSILAAQ